MGLIDYEQPGRGHDERQKVSAEVGVAQALWGHEQEVEETLPKLLLHLRPLLGVVAVDASGVHADSSGHLALVAHQSQQRGDQESWARPRLPEQVCGDEVDGAFSPAGPLHDQGSPSLGNGGLDGLELARSERRVGVAGHRPKERQRRGREGRRHVCSFHGRPTPGVVARQPFTAPSVRVSVSAGTDRGQKRSRAEVSPSA